jgi:hypothetical protein
MGLGNGNVPYVGKTLTIDLEHLALCIGDKKLFLWVTRARAFKRGTQNIENIMPRQIKFHKFVLISKPQHRRMIGNIILDKNTMDSLFIEVTRKVKKNDHKVLGLIIKKCQKIY